MHGTPHGQLPAHDSLRSASIADQLGGLLANPHLARSWLFEAFPRDETTSTNPVTTIRVLLSSDGHKRFPADAEEIQFPQAITRPFMLSVSLQGSLAGTAVISNGEIIIGDAGNTHRDIANHDWHSRDASIFLGPKRGTQVEFAEVAVIKTSGRRLSRDTITIIINDFSFIFDRLLQENFYLGTGGLEGPADLIDKGKPILIGRVDQLEPVSVDAANFIYQIHDGPMDAVDYLKDEMVDLAFDTDVADIFTATPGVGEFATSLATGFIKLQALPNGALTSGSRGLDSPTFGYVDQISPIIKMLAVDFAGLDATAELDPITFNELALHTPVMGRYFREPSSRKRTFATGATGGFFSPGLATQISTNADSGVTIRDAMNVFHNSAMSFSRLLPNKVMTVGRITDPDVASVDFTLDASKDDIKLAPWDWSPYELPVGRILVAYRRYDKTLNASDVDSTIGATELEDISNVFRWAKDELTGNELAQNEDFKTVYLETALYNSADAIALATEQLDMRKVKRDIGRISSHAGLLTRRIGEVGELIDARLGSSPKKFIVLGVENDAGASGLDDLVILEMYG